MRNQFQILIAAIIMTASIRADDATEIVAQMELRVLPPVGEEFEPKDKREAEIIRRNKAQLVFNKSLAEYFRKKMTEDELKAILVFAKSPEGRKLFHSFHSEEFEKLGHKAHKVYQDSDL